MARTVSLARLQVVLAAVCFGTTGTAQALLRPEGVGPVPVGAARIVLGGALLVIVAVLAARRVRGRVVPTEVIRPLGGMARAGLVAVAGAGVALYQVAFFAAADLTGVAVGAVVAIGSGPAFAGALDRVVNGTRLSARWVVATALAVLGAALLGLGGGSGATVDPVGVLLALASGGGYATYTVIARRLIEAGATPDHVMAQTFGTGALLLVPVLLLAGAGWIASAAGLGLILWLAVVTTTLAYALFARGLRVLGAGETATLTLAEPLTATLLGLVVLGERPGAIGAVGAALVLAGLGTLGIPRRPVEPAPRPGGDAQAVAAATGERP